MIDRRAIVEGMVRAQTHPVDERSPSGQRRSAIIDPLDLGVIRRRVTMGVVSVNAEVDTANGRRSGGGRTDSAKHVVTHFDHGHF